MFSLGNDELDNAKSTLSDLKAIVQETQKNGVVFLCYNVGDVTLDRIDRDLFWQYTQFSLRLSIEAK